MRIGLHDTAILHKGNAEPPGWALLTIVRFAASAYFTGVFSATAIAGISKPRIAYILFFMLLSFVFCSSAAAETILLTL